MTTLDSKKRPRNAQNSTADDPGHWEDGKKRAKRPVEFELPITGKRIVRNEQRSSTYFVHYETEVKTIDDLIALDAFYMQGNVDKRKGSNIPFATIHRIIEPLKAIQQMVGLDDVKEQILSIVVFFLQQFEQGNKDMLHTVVYGGPGVGKTKFIGLLAELYAGLGVLPSNKVTVAKRADMVGQYLGQTAIKTRKLIDEAKGGVLLIDEAYSLGDREQRDSYSKECIDVINQALSEEKAELICIIAGYKEDLEQRFFRSNPGLERRFPFRINITDYKAVQLRDIFVQIVRSHGWDVEDNAAPIELFEENREHFRFNGGDMETLFTKTKFLHSLRVFGGIGGEEKKRFTREDIEAGLAAFLDNDSVRERKQFKDLISHIYL